MEQNLIAELYLPLSMNKVAPIIDKVRDNTLDSV